MMSKQNIIVIGGDGFCGWPTSLHLASKGHRVLIIDNLSRRNIDFELGTQSLTPIASTIDRIAVAKKLIGDISFEQLDIATNYAGLKKLMNSFEADCVVHFGEQRAAPHSMISDVHRNYSVNNNVSGTHNVCSAIVEIDPKIRLIHLGTMGVYGYSKDFGKIPEGYLNITINQTDKKVDVLYPANPGSIYHMTKCLDQLIFQFYNKNWQLDITDLHQGIVWGINTEETKLDSSLVNRFDYDGIYGTVLNRFLTQAANGESLTVYGTGGQTRAFINIADTAKCIRLAVENCELTNKVRIFNQVAETKNILELAQTVSSLFGASIKFVENPRKELAENDLEVANNGLVSLGFEPILLNDALATDLKTLAHSLTTRFDANKILTSPKW